MTEPGRLAYLDCFSGISGDMFLAALLDAGLPLAELEKNLAALALPGWNLRLEKKLCAGIAATSLQVECAEDHPRRDLAEITRIIEKSGLAPRIKDKSRAVFTLLAEAEAKVHGCGMDEVHFHEVGAMDAIIDVVGVVAGLETLGVGELTCSPLPMPRGWVRCAHGRLPLPGPAVCELLRGVPAYGVELDAELVTPTGAALVKALACTFGPMPAMAIAAVGYGAGSRELATGQANLLRLLTGASLSPVEAQAVEVIETHLDDWPPETFPYLSERLFALGALDVALIPIQMKKGRPGFMLRVIAEPATALAAKDCIFRETTAIGLRFRTEQRWTLPRKTGTVPTPWGRVLAKKITTPDGEIFTPEYEDCRRVAETSGVAIKQVYAEVARASGKDFKEN